MNLLNRMISRLRRNSLSILLLLAIIPVIVFSILTYITTQDIIFDRSYQLAQQQTEQIKKEIDDLFSDIHQFTIIGEQENTIQFLVNREGTVDEGQRILEIIDLYRDIYSSSEHILDISILSKDGKIISENRGIYSLESLKSYIPNAQLLIDDPTTNLIEPTMRNGFPAIAMTSAIHQKVESDTIGFIKIVIDATAIRQLLTDHPFWESGSFTILDETGEALFSTNQTNDFISNLDLNDTNRLSTICTSERLVVCETSELSNWTIIGYGEEDDLSDSAMLEKHFFLIAFITMITAITIFIFINHRFILPIRRLREKMEQVSDGNYDALYPLGKRKDEIAALGNSFNKMVKKFQLAFQKSMEDEKQLKLAEFRAMQAQINPHFLYNALDTIIWMAETKNSSKVIRITKALSQFFRLALNKGKNVVTIENEMAHIRNYLIIQKIRYEDILDVSFHLNEEILSYEILKLSLQPLVENAIYHGIKNKRGKGFIRIKGDFNPQGDIGIDIIDNGVGMDKEQLEIIRIRLKRGIPTKQGSGGFGMVNVHQRIQLFYGESYGLTISSWKGSGTRIRLTIPAKR